MMSGYDCWKKNVFSCWQKIATDGDDWTWAGKVFQTVAAATGTAGEGMIECQPRLHCHSPGRVTTSMTGEQVWKVIDGHSEADVTRSQNRQKHSLQCVTSWRRLNGDKSRGHEPQSTLNVHSSSVQYSRLSIKYGAIHWWNYFKLYTNWIWH